jgi:hypothetical protein
MHCLVHALNNLAQRPAVTPRDLDALADRLAPGAPPLPFLHPHRTALLGNYDVNVLVSSAASLSCQLKQKTSYKPTNQPTNSLITDHYPK